MTATPARASRSLNSWLADDVAELNALADRAGIDKAGACTFYGIQSLAQMTVKDARTFRHSMKKRIANQENQE